LLSLAWASTSLGIGIGCTSSALSTFAR
jgi:hypothetical protein